MREKLWIDYLYFLLDSINFHDDRWINVLIYMHNMPFEVIVERDDNRVSDAIYERYAFFRDGNDIYFDRDEASVIEVLVTFVKRISDDYIPHYNFDGENMQFIIFESFLRNLGLNYDEPFYKIDEKVSFWMERKYKNDGKGSIMPLKSVKYDYRNTEIWSQFFVFLNDFNIKNWEDFEVFLDIR